MDLTIFLIVPSLSNQTLATSHVTPQKSPTLIQLAMLHACTLGLWSGPRWMVSPGMFMDAWTKDWVYLNILLLYMNLLFPTNTHITLIEGIRFRKTNNTQKLNFFEEHNAYAQITVSLYFLTY